MEAIFEFIFGVIVEAILIPLLNFVGAIFRLPFFILKKGIDLEYLLENGKGYNYFISVILISLLIYFLVK